MTKYVTTIGYAIIKEREDEPSVFENTIVKKKYRCERTKTTRNLTISEVPTGNISASVTISFLANTFARENMFNIRYATYMGQEWIVTSVDFKDSKITCYLGGLYNGKET